MIFVAICQHIGRGTHIFECYSPHLLRDGECLRPSPSAALGEGLLASGLGLGSNKLQLSVSSSRQRKQPCRKDAADAQAFCRMAQGWCGFFFQMVS